MTRFFCIAKYTRGRDPFSACGPADAGTSAIGSPGSPRACRHSSSDGIHGARDSVGSQPLGALASRQIHGATVPAPYAGHVSVSQHL
jgi:hypothetical protein